MSDSNPPSTLFPADNPAIIAHMNMLQGIITRLANNSVSCKTWCLTLVGALVSLAGATHAPGVIGFALVPVVIFGYLDTMYLAQEKSYRDLFNRIRGLVNSGKYDLSNVFEAGAPVPFRNRWMAFWSWSVWPVYGGLAAAYEVARCNGWLSVLTVIAK